MGHPYFVRVFLMLLVCMTAHQGLADPDKNAAAIKPSDNTGLASGDQESANSTQPSASNVTSDDHSNSKEPEDTSSSDRCIQLNAAFNYNGASYLFSDDFFIELDSNNTQINLQDLRDGWNGLAVSEADAGLNLKDSVYFFKDTKFYQYSSILGVVGPFDIESYWGEKINGGVTAAGHFYHDIVIFFYHCRYYIYGRNYGIMGPFSLTEIGLPCEIDAAFNPSADDPETIALIKYDQLWYISFNGSIEGPVDANSVIHLENRKLCSEADVWKRLALGHISKRETPKPKKGKNPFKNFWKQKISKDLFGTDSANIGSWENSDSLDQEDKEKLKDVLFLWLKYKLGSAKENETAKEKMERETKLALLKIWLKKELDDDNDGNQSDDFDLFGKRRKRDIEDLFSFESENESLDQEDKEKLKDVLYLWLEYKLGSAKENETDKEKMERETKLALLKIWLKKELDDDNDGNQSDDFDLFGKRRKRDIEDLFSFESENESLQQEDRERLKDVLYLWLETRLGSAKENETGTEKMERKMKLALLKIWVKKELDDDNEDNESDEIDFFVKRRKRDIEDLFFLESENESLDQEDKEKLKDVLYLWLEFKLGSAKENETDTEKMERRMKLALLKIWLKKELDDDNDGNQSDDFDLFGKRRKRDIEDLFSFESENESLQQEDRERLKDVLYLWLETRLGSAKENETGTEKMERKMKLALLKFWVKKELDDDNEDNESDEIDFFVKRRKRDIQDLWQNLKEKDNKLSQILKGVNKEDNKHVSLNLNDDIKEKLNEVLKKLKRNTRESYSIFLEATGESSSEEQRREQEMEEFEQEKELKKENHQNLLD